MKRSVPWADFNCEVTGTANNARTGTALIREIEPDILITDICMPGQDGLTMLAGLRSEFPDLQVTVLTGYRDFAYAQEAIRLVQRIASGRDSPSYSDRSEEGTNNADLR